MIRVQPCIIQLWIHHIMVSWIYPFYASKHPKKKSLGWDAHPAPILLMLRPWSVSMFSFSVAKQGAMATSDVGPKESWRPTNGQPKRYMISQVAELYTASGGFLAETSQKQPYRQIGLRIDSTHLMGFTWFHHVKWLILDRIHKAVILKMLCWIKSDNGRPSHGYSLTWVVSRPWTQFLVPACSLNLETYQCGWFGFWWALVL